MLYLCHWRRAGVYRVGRTRRLHFLLTTAAGQRQWTEYIQEAQKPRENRYHHPRRHYSRAWSWGVYRRLTEYNV